MGQSNSQKPLHVSQTWPLLLKLPPTTTAAKDSALRNAVSLLPKGHMCFGLAAFVTRHRRRRWKKKTEKTTDERRNASSRSIVSSDRLRNARSTSWDEKNGMQTSLRSSGSLHNVSAKAKSRVSERAAKQNGVEFPPSPGRLERPSDHFLLFPLPLPVGRRWFGPRCRRIETGNITHRSEGTYSCKVHSCVSFSLSAFFFFRPILCRLSTHPHDRSDSMATCQTTNLSKATSSLPERLLDQNSKLTASSALRQVTEAVQPYATLITLTYPLAEVGRQPPCAPRKILITMISISVAQKRCHRAGQEATEASLAG